MIAVHFGSPWVLAALPVVAAFLMWQIARSYAQLTPRRRRLQLGLRLSLITLLLLALSQPVLVHPATAKATIVLVDVSRSVPDRTLQAWRAFVQKARGPNVTLVTFGDKPRVAREIERHDEEGSDLAAAISFARALPPGNARLVLLSDGQDRHGEAVLRAADGAEVSVARVAAPAVLDARLAGLRVPEGMRRDQPTRALLSVNSTAAGAALLRFEENGSLIEERQVKLEPGSQSFAFEFQPATSGLVRYRAQVKLAGDAEAENDTWVQPVMVSGTPRVLLVADTPEEGGQLEEVLTVQGLQIQSVQPASVPTSVDELLSYDAVVLCGVAPSDLDRLREAALVSYVRDTGGGLLFVSGRRGLRRDPEGRSHPLESALPVEMTAPSEREEPPVAMVLLIDRSGSMTGEKLGFAKQAALRVIDKLTAHDQVGVIAFDAKFDWILPLQPIDDKPRLREAVGSLGAGGGTRFLPALEEAYYTLATTPATVRHALLLTDGVSTDPNSFPELLAKARQRGITVSTVAIGHGADVKLLGEIAKLGGGRYTLAQSASQVPDIFVNETESVQRQAAQRGLTQARLVVATRELTGIDFAGAPPLRGYLRSRAKAGSETLVDTPTRDPLLVRWQYGLGKVMVFTSDAASVWGAPWLSWSGFGPLWSQLVRGLVRPHGRHDVDLRLEAEGNRLRLAATIVDGRGRLASDYQTRAQVIDGRGETHDVELGPVAPGLYRGEAEVAAGTVLARASASRDGRRLEGDWTVLARPYSEELAASGPNTALLGALARSGGYVDDPAQVTAPGTVRTPRATRLGLALILLAVLIFLLDVTVKRAYWEKPQ